LKKASEMESAVYEIKSALENMPPEERESLIRRVAEQCEVPVSSLPRDTFLTWEEIKSLSRDDLIDFGSHSVSHPNLASVSRDAALSEIADSKRTIEEKLERAVMSFCYPDGQSSEEVKSIVRDSRYDTATTIVYGLDDERTDPYALKRIYIQNMPLCVFVAHISGVFRTGALVSRFNRFVGRLKNRMR
jgi:peptidoglycan/xylan/chitin deacetylase (PgdA/CDA1 family)